MSWRILFEPAYFNDNPSDTAGADEIVPLGATDEQVDQVAHKWAWHLPMKVWTVDEEDHRLLRFLHILNEGYSMTTDDVQIYVKKKR